MGEGSLGWSVRIKARCIAVCGASAIRVKPGYRIVPSNIKKHARCLVFQFHDVAVGFDIRDINININI